MNLFSPERRSARSKRWRKRFPKFSLSSWHSSRIAESVCGAFRAGAQASRVVRWASGTQVVSTLGSKSLRLEGLEPRQMLTTTPWNLGTEGDFFQDWSDPNLITSHNDWSGVPSIVGYLGEGLAAVTGVDPRNVLGPGSGTVSVLPGQSNPAILTEGFVEFESNALLTNAVVGMQAGGSADAPHLVLHLNSVGRENIGLRFNLRDVESTSTNAQQPFALQYRLGDAGLFTNVPGQFLADATVANATVDNMFGLPTRIILPQWSNQPHLEIRFITTNAAAQDEFLGIDDISVTSDPLNAAPAATSQIISTNEDVEIDGVLSGTDPDSNPLTFAIASPPVHGSFSFFDANTGAFTYRPNESYNGTDSFQFTASDGLLTSTPATVSITVNPVDDLPTAVAQSLTTDKNSPLSGTLSGTDVDGEAITHFTLISPPANGSLDFDSSTGAFTYHPSLNYVGPDSFEFQANNDALGVPAVVTIAVVEPVSTSNFDGPAYPPPGGVAFAGSGPGSGRSGGRTNSYDLSANPYADALDDANVLYWAPSAASLSLSGSSFAKAFNSSNLVSTSATQAIWQRSDISLDTGGDNIPNTTVTGRLVLTVSGAPAAILSQSSVPAGMSGHLGVALPVIDTAFAANFIFQIWSGSNWVPADNYYDISSTGGLGSFKSFGAGFWTVNDVGVATPLDDDSNANAVDENASAGTAVG
ncbi:MAG TPA: cadherin-like domain-containing protein, partial [Lacipirellula sp.]